MYIDIYIYSALTASATLWARRTSCSPAVYVCKYVLLMYIQHSIVNIILFNYFTFTYYRTYNFSFSTTDKPVPSLNTILRNLFLGGCSKSSMYTS